MDSYNSYDEFAIENNLLKEYYYIIILLSLFEKRNQKT